MSFFLYIFIFFFILGFKLQHSLENLRENQQQKEIKESEITEQALLKLFRITVFLVRTHLAHTTNYEDFVQFIGNDLKDEGLSVHLEMADSNKNATCLSKHTVTQSLNVISDWMKDETLSVVKQCDFTTIMLDESTDESNQSEMSLTVQILQNSMIESHILDLVQLRRCDAKTIFSEVETYLIRDKI